MTRLIIAIVCALLLGAELAWAAPIIDGQVTAEEGYQYVTTISPDASLSTGRRAVGDALLHLYQDELTQAMSVAVVLPRDYVDNTYNELDAAIRTHPTWNNRQKDKHYDPSATAVDAQTRHKFGELEGSDKAEFTIQLGAGTPVSFTLDYLEYKRADKGKGAVDVINSGTTAKDGDDGAGIVVTSMTSMHRNMLHFGNTPLPSGYDVKGGSPTLKEDASDPGTYLYEAADPAEADWVFDAVYEFQIDGSFFNGQNVLSADGFVGFDMMFTALHASPSKNADERDVFNDRPGNPPFTEIPEPASLALLGLGATLVVRRRR